MERFRKVYIDSRHRYSGTGSAFSVELSDSVQLGDAVSMYVSAVTFPNSWHTVSTLNNQLYWIEFDGVATASKIATIPSRLYTHDSLAAAIELAMGAGFTVVSDQQEIVVTAAVPRLVRIPSHFELTDEAWKTLVWNTSDTVAPYNTNSPRDLNFMISPEMTSRALATSFASGVVDLAPRSVLYLHSSLGTYGSMDSAGRKTCVASILVDVPYGAVVHLDHRGLDADSVDVSFSRFKNVRFSLQNCYGQTIDLRGGDMSIELCFAQK